MGENEPKGNNRKPKKRKRCRWKTALIVFGLVLGVLILKVVLILTAKPTLSVDYVAEWNRVSKPADYDPNENAALDYQKAIEAFVEMPAQIAFTDVKWPGDMNDTELAIFEKWLVDNSEALAHLKRGARKPYCWIEDCYLDNSLAKWTPAFPLSRFRSLAALAGWHAKFEATKNHPDRAVDDIVAGYRFSSHLMRTKPIIYQIVAITIRSLTIHNAFIILDKHQFDSNTLKHFQHELQQHFDNRKTELDFQHAKLATLDAIQLLFTDDGKGNGHLIPAAAAIMLSLRSSAVYGIQPTHIVEQKVMEYRQHAHAIWLGLFGPDKNQTIAAAEELFEYLNELKGQSFHQLHKGERRPEDEIYGLCRQYLVLGLSCPSYKLLELYQRIKAEQSAVIATIAIMRHKAEKDHLPERLQDLISNGYLKELPMDPYSDGTLVYKRVGDDFRLYSVGTDFEDDGGVAIDRTKKRPDIGDQVFWPVERPKAEQAPLTRRAHRVK